MASQAKMAMCKVSRRSHTRIAAALWATAFACFFSLIISVTSAFAQTAKIVGTGAVSCIRFNQAVDAAPQSMREYFAWAQGYMSGVMMRSPAGVDDALDLSSNALPIVEQMRFVRRYCALHVDGEYADAIQALYHALGGRGM